MFLETVIDWRGAVFFALVIFSTVWLIVWDSERLAKKAPAREDDGLTALMDEVMGKVNDGVMIGVGDPDTGFVKILSMNPASTMSGMGAHSIYDYAQENSAFEDRLGRCYELTTKAVLPGMGAFPREVPKPLGVIHGKWCGPGAKGFIDHAVVLLSDGRVWEPITSTICDPDQFSGFTKFQSVVSYNNVEASRLALRHQNYGPWHL